MGYRASLTEQLRQVWMKTQVPEATIAFPFVVSADAQEGLLQPACATSPQSDLVPHWVSPVVPDEPWPVKEDGCAAQQEGDVSATMDYIAQLLLADGLSNSRDMLIDSLAYQTTFNEFSELIGNVETRLGLSDGEGGEREGLLPCGSAPQEEQVLVPASSSFAEDSESVRTWDTYRDTAFVSDGLTGKGCEGDPASTCFSGEAGTGENHPKTLKEVADMLLECGQAVLADDHVTAAVVVAKIREFATPFGSHLQRLSHYFVEALVSKLSGTGPDLLVALSGPSSAEILRGVQNLVRVAPRLPVAYAFANNAMLEAVQGAEKLHVIDYGIQHGLQWPSFIQALARRPEGPPQLFRLTGIEFPQPGLHPDARVKETGRRLARFAADAGVPFAYKAVADKWENVLPSSLNLRRGEVVVVYSMFRLRHLLDDSVMPSNPRMTVLKRIRSMDPRLLVTGFLHGDGNMPFFMTRLREAIFRQEMYFDYFDATSTRDSPSRLVMERLLGRDILSAVACEGMARLERPDPYTLWQRRVWKAGFRQIPLPLCLFNNIREMMRGFHPDFCLAQDDSWLLLGWKQKVFVAMAAWEPRNLESVLATNLA